MVEYFIASGGSFGSIFGDIIENPWIVGGGALLLVYFITTKVW